MKIVDAERHKLHACAFALQIAVANLQSDDPDSIRALEEANTAFFNVLREITEVVGIGWDWSRN